MKLKLMFMFCLAFSLMIGNKLHAQSVTFTGPANVSSGQEFEITAVGESIKNHIGSMPITGSAEDKPYTGTVGCGLTYTSYFNNAKPTVPGKFRYKLTNTTQYAKSVKITFIDVVMVNSEALSNYNTNLTYTIEVGPGATPVSFANSAQSGSFVKDDCVNADGPGPAVVYTVPAGKYQAASQATADALAVADVNRNGQAYANENGTCLSEFTFTVVSPNKPDENGQYPPRSQVIATIRLPKPIEGGVTFEIQVTYPSQRVSVYKENTVRLSLSSQGAYLIKGRIIKNSTGIASPWLASVISVRN